MPVPFEAVIPMAIVATLFTVTGTGFSGVSRLANEGKPLRHNVDEWERMMMRRDFRLTGTKRGQAVRTWLLMSAGCRGPRIVRDQ